MNKRPSNVELCEAFRALLTSGATDAFNEAAQRLDRLGSGPLSGEDLIYATKTYRGALWKAFAEIERRLCPQPEDFRK